MVDEVAADFVDKTGCRRQAGCAGKRAYDRPEEEWMVDEVAADFVNKQAVAGGPGAPASGPTAGQKKKLAGQLSAGKLE